MAYELSSTSWGQEELDAMQRVLRSGRFTMGEQVRLFEDAFAARFGMKHAVMVNSGSSANLVGVAALFYRSTRPLQRGDEVIVPAISWATTFHPLQQYGLKLRFVDVELDTLNMDVSNLEAALTPRTRMVVAVSILGNPAALDRIRAFCDAHDLIMFEDNCESLGASLNGRLCGTFGDINTFSTFYSHHISTMEGGLLVTNDVEIDHLARAIRNHGWARDVPADSIVNQGQQHDDPFFEAYRFVVPGYNVRPLELAGAVGIEQLKKLDGMLRGPAAERRAFRRAVPRRRPLHHSARERLEFLVQLHDHPEPGVDTRSGPRDGRDAKRRHRIPHDHRRLLSASCGREVLRLRHRRRPESREARPRARIFCGQPPPRHHRGARSSPLGTKWGLTPFLRFS